MPRYFYTAKTLKGESRSGDLEAKNQHELARTLREEGLILIKVEPEELIAGGKFFISIPFLGKVSLVEKVMFTRSLRVMVKAGISLPRALRILALQSKSKKFRKTILEIMEEIIKGKSFSETLSKYPNIFSELFYNMVKVGEEGGTLEEVLEILTRQMEKEKALKSKIKGAMIYPIVIIVTMLIIGVLMMILVVPKLAQIFIELGVELPFSTKVIIASGSFLTNYWYLLLIFSFILVVLLRIILKTKIGKLLIDTLILKIPIISPIIRKTNSANTVRTLGSLISSGVPIVRSLEVVSGTLGNIHYKQAIKAAAENVKKGVKLHEVLKECGNIYPVLLVNMIEIGEETGETSNILGELADFFEEEVANATKNLSAVIEPVLMLIIGGAVGFFAVSMIQPIYSIMGAL